jgi:glycosyltransferase involved in cell wall biosynthesis
MIKKSSFFISAIYTSPSNSMGGNTKIMLEMINHLVNKYNFVIFTCEPDTFRLNIKELSKITIIEVPYEFQKFNLITHYKEVKYVNNFYQEYFKKNTIKSSDFFYSCSDFAPDVIPVANLRRKHAFNWIATLYLFIPNPLDNLSKKYGFPILKYIIYYFYQRYLFSIILKYADKFIITNDVDRKQFTDKMQHRIFAAYGGVNLDEVDSANKAAKKKFDAVFCSRLHPQKGISQLLDIWKKVVLEIPKAQLAIIGNGDPNYEIFLKQKVIDLELSNNIHWLGYVNGINKYKVYNSSKIFLHSTIYDNNGMVAAESLCAGLPVLMYDLPTLKKVYNKGCIKIPYGKQELFAENVIKIIKNKTKIKISKQDLEDIRNKWDWNNRMEDVAKFLVN